GTVCVVGKMRDLILQLSKSSIYSTKPMDSSRNNGEFSTQEIRAYLPISLGQTTLTPYTRLGLDRWSNWDWQDDPDREGHDFNRLGLLYAYDFNNGLSMTLEYAYEWENHDEGENDRFHYAGVGVNYAF
ncbi:OmpG family monomeric porin, partial [Enterobacter chengduensis]|uniref:OmpG family monomeric porin n=1 Tax=Enterobacter chengduensis TaxID=2494701 RepID=UPI0020760BA9